MSSETDCSSTTSGLTTPTGLTPIISPQLPPLDQFLRLHQSEDLTKQEITGMIGDSDLCQDCFQDPLEDVRALKKIFESCTQLDILISKICAIGEYNHERQQCISDSEIARSHENIYCSLFWVLNPNKREDIRKWARIDETKARRMKRLDSYYQKPGRSLPPDAVMYRYKRLLGTHLFEMNNRFVIHWVKKNTKR